MARLDRDTLDVSFLSCFEDIFPQAFEQEKQIARVSRDQSLWVGAHAVEPFEARSLKESRARLAVPATKSKEAPSWIQTGVPSCWK